MSSAICSGVLHVADDRGDTLGQRRIALAAIEHADLVPLGHRPLDAGQRNLPGTTDEKNAETHEILPQV
jgi:hypothetical protein